MKKHMMPAMKEGGVNVTPLIDIVMCLIIFFMLVAKIGVATGADSKIEPPSTILGTKIEDMGNTLTLNVTDPNPRDESGNFLSRHLKQPEVRALIDGSTQPREIKIEQNFGSVTDQPLLRVLKAAVEGDPKKNVQPNPNFKVIILAEKDLQYSMLEQVLVTCAQAKVKNVNFQTRQVKAEAGAPG